MRCKIEKWPPFNKPKIIVKNEWCPKDFINKVNKLVLPEQRSNKTAKWLMRNE